MDSYFAVTAPGLETLTAFELSRLLNSEFRIQNLEFKGDLRSLYRANLHLRTASRVLARLGQFFYARTFAELRERAAHLPWERFLRPGQPVTLRVTCHKSKLYHSDAVAERVAAAIADRLGKESPQHKPGDEESDHSAQLIVVRVANDQVTISVDSSGELLHRRGYRQAVAKAPLRETLAAGMLLASGWDGQSPLIDPFCGSGTIPIEAALMALGIPPGINRRFAFMDWPDFDKKLWQAIHAENQPSNHPPSSLPTISASDRDAGAVKMARENAERAGVADCIRFECQAVSGLRSLPTSESAKSPDFALQSPGWIVTNPPYGLRVSEGKDLRNLYAQFGNVLREKCPGWQVAVLSSDLMLLGQLGLKLDTSFGMTNGGVRVRLGRGKVV